LFPGLAQNQGRERERERERERDGGKRENKKKKVVSELHRFSIAAVGLRE
jgi:hypothetical protein